MEVTERRALGGLAAIVAYFTWQVQNTFRAFFSPDDIMNLHQYLLVPWSDLLRACLEFWSPVYRPFGGLVYRSLHAAFGFTAFPFHAFLWLILVGIIVAVYGIASIATKSRAYGLLAAFLASFHPKFADLYFSFGTIYDSLSSLLVLLVVWNFLASDHPRYWLLLAVLAAFGSKEVAVAIPGVLVMHALIV